MYLKLVLSSLCIGIFTFALSAQQVPALQKTGVRFKQEAKSPEPYPIVEQTGEPCLYDELLNKALENPEYRAAFEENERQIRKRSERIRAEMRAGMKADLLTIPVVFHVLHVGEAEGVGHNIPDDQIISSVTALNRDFRRLATDGGIAQGAGPDMEIEFCLATIDPDGNPTNGINRVNASGTGNYQNIGIDEDVNGTAVKNLSKWPTADYVNIWVVREINDQGEFGAWGGGTVGYAYPVQSSPVLNPGNNPSNNINDGIVVVNFSLGNDPDQSEGWNIYGNQKKNRTLTHEMGHHLNLQHPFRANTCSESDCATEGDFVCDTPPTVASSSCNSPACGGTQLVENYMDYTGENCADMFTEGQKVRMRAVLEGFSRNSLTSSVGCSAGFANADFEADVTTVGIGETVTFTDLSTGSPAVDDWDWDFGDGTQSTLTNPTHSYTTGGFKTVTLTVSNGSESDTEEKTDYIFVTEEATGTIGGNCDTLKNYTDAEEEALTIYSSGGELLPGINGSTFNGYAELFQNTGAYVFQDFLIAIERISDLGAPSNITFNVYQATGGAPGAVLTSGTVPFSSLTANSYNLISFADTVSVTGDFFIGWEFEATSDTLGVFATQFRENEYASVRVKQGAGWFSFNPANSFSMAIQTIPLKGVEAEIVELNNASLDFCLTQDLQFGIANDFNVASYDWTFTNGGAPASSNDAEPTVAYNTAGTKNISVEVTGRCGETDTDDISAEAYAAPDLTETIQNADCGGTNGSISVVHNGPETLTYNWVGQGNTTNTLSGIGAGTYTLEATNGPCVETFEYEVTELAPAVEISFFIEEPSCELNNGVIAALADDLTDLEFYWNGSATPQNDTLFDQGAGVYDLVVRKNGCQVAALDTFLTNEGVVPDLSFDVSNPTCGFADGQIIVSHSGAEEVAYSWNTGSLSDTISALEADTFIVTAEITPCIKIDTVILEEQEVFEDFTLQARQPSCTESNGFVSVLTEADTAGMEFFWNGNSVAEPSLKDKVGPGTFEIEVYRNGCLIGMLDTVLVDTGVVVSAGFVYTPNPAVEGQTITFTSDEQAVENQHFWYFTGATPASSNDINPEVVFEAGTFEVEHYIYSDLCADTLLVPITVEPAIGISESSTIEGLKLYPNPANNYLIIESLTETTHVTSAKIIDLLGRTVLQVSAEDSKVQKLDLSNLKTGTYMVVLQGGFGTTSQKVTIMR